MGSERIARFSVSLPERLLSQYDELVRAKGYKTRSHAVADMIRAQLVEHQQTAGKGELAGTITLVYDHHHGRVEEELTDLQHAYLAEIVSSVHVHLDHDNCLEVIILRGQARRIRRIADRLLTARGVKHGKLTLTTTGAQLPA